MTGSYLDTNAGVLKTDSTVTNWVASFGADSDNSSGLPVTLTEAGSPYTVVFSKADAPDISGTITLTATNAVPTITGSSSRNATVDLPFATNYTFTGLDGASPTLTGTDAGLFTWTPLNATTYQLALIADPVIGDLANAYAVTITANDTVNAAQTLSVTITVVEASVSFYTHLYDDYLTAMPTQFLNPWSL